MHIWIDAEVECSGKRSDVVRCTETFPAKIQVRMTHSSITPESTVPSAITGIKGHPPLGWMAVNKTYFSIPSYFCSSCNTYGKAFENRP